MARNENDLKKEDRLREVGVNYFEKVLEKLR